MLAALRIDLDPRLQDTSTACPSALANARSVSLQNRMPTDIVAHKPVAPATPLEACGVRVLLFQHEAALASRCVCAEGFVQDG